MLLFESLTLSWKPRSFLFHKNKKDKTIPHIWKVLQLIQDYSWHVYVKFTKLCLIPLTSAPQVQLCRPVGIKARNTRNSLWRASLELSAIRSISQIMVSTYPKNTKKTSPPNPSTQECLFSSSWVLRWPSSAFLLPYCPYPFTNTGSWLCQGMPPLRAKTL